MIKGLTVVLIWVGGVWLGLTLYRDFGLPIWAYLVWCFGIGWVAAWVAEEA